jgi:hypothetical protein
MLAERVEEVRKLKVVEGRERDRRRRRAWRKARKRQRGKKEAGGERRESGRSDSGEGGPRRGETSMASCRKRTDRREAEEGGMVVSRVRKVWRR